MRLLVHTPTTELDAPEAWDPVQRARVSTLVQRAIQRAVSQLDTRGVQVEVICAFRPGAPRRTSASVAGTESVGERLDTSRLRPDDARYGIPSFDGGGAIVDVPVGHSATGALSGDDPGVTELALAGHDRVVRGEFPRALVIRAEGQLYVWASGSPHVIAANLWHAMQWGLNLFGALGFAVLHPDGGSPAGPFFVVPLERPLSIGDLGGLDATGRVLKPGWLTSPERYTTVTVTTADKLKLQRIRGGDAGWDEQQFQRALALVPMSERLVAEADIQRAAAYLLPAGADIDSSRELGVLVNMDRTLFAAMPWDVRVRYLMQLLATWGGERRRQAVIEIVRASSSTAELEAIFASLRARGVYEKLFSKLDGSVFSLLEFLGEFRQERPVNSRYLIDLLIELQVLPGSAPADPLRELGRAVDGFTSWLAGIIGGIVDLFANLDHVIEAIPHLGQFIWTLQMAQLGDPQAQAFVAELVRQGASRSRKALRGLEYAEELGTSYAARGGGAGIGGDILGRLKWALVCEVLSWFIGIGEIKATVKSLELSEKVAIVARLLRSVRLLGRLSQAGVEATRIEHMLLALGHLAEIVEEAHLARIVELLAPEYLSRVEALAQAISLPRGAGVHALRAAAAGRADLLRAVEEVADAMAVTARVEARAALAGSQGAEMSVGLRALLVHSGLDRAGLLRIVESVPPPLLGEYLHTLTVIKPSTLRAWAGEALLARLAENPRVLGLIREAGSDLVDRILTRSRTWDGVGQFADGLAVQRNALGSPVAYQQLLEQLRAGNAAAFEQVETALRAHRLTQATRTGATAVAQLGEAFLRESRYANIVRSLEEVERIWGPATRTTYAADIARLSQKELGGLEHIAAMEHATTSQMATKDWGWIDVLRHPDQGVRFTLLTVLDDIGPRTTSGLERAVARCLDDPQAGLGQLLAARTLVQRYGATQLRLELMTERVIAGGSVRREFDIEASLSGRAVHVEVKTNMVPLGGGRARASSEWVQIGKDLAIHARTGYRDLLYLYHPSVQGQLQSLGQEMLELFGASGQAVDALLLQRLTAEGVPVQTARQAFVQWLANNGLTVYSL